VCKTKLRRQAFGARPSHLDGVGADGEAVLGRKAVEPAVEIAVAELDDTVARATDEVMVVALAAEAVADLAGMVHQCVHDPVLAEERECAVDGRKSDCIAARDEPAMDLLRRRVVRFRGQGTKHREPLPRGTDAVSVEERLRERGHGRRVQEMRMKTILVLLVFLLSATACGTKASSQGRKHVVAAFYPLAYAAQQIGGPTVEVTNLTPPGVEPHDLEATPGDVQAIHSADLVLLLGHGFQPQLEDAAGRGKKVLWLLDTPGLRRFGNGDPHVWLDPVRYALIGRRIGQALGRPQAAARLESRLRALDREYRRGLAHCTRHEIVTSHEAFAYLAQRYQLRQVAITGLSPEAEPAPKDLQHVVDLVRRTHATTIFFETLVSPRIAETVARETHAKTAVLDPIEGLTPAEANRGEDYFTVMRANLRALRGALGCR
jgi:zinc transport system substrate-binding protein